jgi:hypothetical protein
MVDSDGRSVIRNLRLQNSITAGSGFLTFSGGATTAQADEHITSGKSPINKMVKSEAAGTKVEQEHWEIATNPTGN